ncbi:MAG: hypothetical protein P8Y18_12365 [Candidatus Bathyarchaeota archaeon]
MRLTNLSTVVIDVSELRSFDGESVKSEKKPLGLAYVRFSEIFCIMKL